MVLDLSLGPIDEVPVEGLEVLLKPISNKPTLRFLFGRLDLLTLYSAARQKLWTSIRCEIDLGRALVKQGPLQRVMLYIIKTGCSLVSHYHGGEEC